MKILKANNGLTVLFKHMEKPVVDINYYVQVGSLDENVDQAGYCHALEHMLFQGTTSQSWKEIDSNLRQLGSYFNAWTLPQYTFYKVNCLKKHWRKAYEILADIMYNPTFPKSRWEEIEKSVVVSEIQGNWDDPQWLLEEETFIDALGKEYHPVVGSLDTIQKASIEDLKNFYDKYYCGDNVILSIAGDLSPSQVLKAVNKHDRLRDTKSPQRKKLKFGFNYKAVNIKKRDLEQSYIYLLKPLSSPRTLRGGIVLDIATECLSRYLFEELREKRGLCYGTGASLYEDIPKYCYFDIMVATDTDRFARTENTLRKALRNFASDLTDERIESVIASEHYHTALATESTSTTTKWLWDSWVDKVKKDPFKTHLKIVEGLNLGDVRRVIKRNFKGRLKFAKIKEKI